jgi:hypothetical protein
MEASSNDTAQTVSSCLAAAERLYALLRSRYWREEGLVGPDCGIRFNYRIGRFVKSYLSWAPWRDNLYYLQGQGYWTLASLALYQRTGREDFRAIALRCSEQMLDRQLDNGAWTYPNREWKGRIATAEGTWGSLGLLAAFESSGTKEFLDGALRWHDFVESSIGFSAAPGGIAVNYFAGSSEAVPNNTAFYLRFLAGLQAATGDQRFLSRAEELLGFLTAVQAPTGEFPYTVDIGPGRRRLEHFQCYQYNAFQCLDLMRYRQLTGDDRALPLVRSVLGFLRRGIAPDGHAAYQCGHTLRRVTYHTAVTAAALAHGEEHGVPGLTADAVHAYGWLLARQRDDGSFCHSEQDYGILHDCRVYPRHLAMVTCHLVVADRLKAADIGSRRVA